MVHDVQAHGRPRRKAQHRVKRPPLTGEALVAAMVADTALAEQAARGFDEIERGEYVTLEELRTQRGNV